MQSTLNPPDTDEAWRQIAPLLETAMDGLSERDRNAVVLRYFENQSLAQVGAALGVNEDGARMRVNRALEKLRACFVKKGVMLTGTLIASAVTANSVQAAPVALTKTISAVAVAKGAAAGTSTLALVKGALKLMAWSKMKTAIVAGMGVLLVAGIATLAVDRKEPGHEYRGTLRLVFPLSPGRPQTNTYAVHLLSKPPNWELSLVSADQKHEVLSSPKQTFEVNLYDTPPEGPLNTCEIRIVPSARPLDDREAEHVWLALLSKSNFIGQKLPLPDVGLGMAEPSMINEASGTMRDTSPRQMRWDNEFPNGRTSRLEGEFKWLASTNLDGLNIPTASRMTMYLADTNGSRKIASFSELVIEGVTPLTTAPRTFPMILGRNIIYDYRSCDFSKLGGMSAMKRYELQGSQGLDKLP